MNNKKMRVVEWFSGIKAFTRALERQNVDYEMVDSVELDKHAIKSQNALYGTNYVPTDINDVDVNGYGEVDILVAGWPCQDYSVAGKQLGTFAGERSNLILVTINKISEMKIKPKYIVLENVKGLLSKKFRSELNAIMGMFDALGYQWDQALLNSKYFGVPQSRERVFIVLTRNDLPKIIINHLEDYGFVEKTLRDIIDFSVSCEKATIKIDGTKVYFKNTMKNYNGKDIELDVDKINNQKRDEINKVAILGEVKVNQVNKFIGVEGQYPTYTDNHGSGNQIMYERERVSASLVQPEEGLSRNRWSEQDTKVRRLW